MSNSKLPILCNVDGEIFEGKPINGDGYIFKRSSEYSSLDELLYRERWEEEVQDRYEEEMNSEYYGEEQNKYHNERSEGEISYALLQTRLIR